MPQNESVHAAVGTLQLRVELGDEMCVVVTILKMITYMLIKRPTLLSHPQAKVARSSSEAGTKTLTS